MAYWEVPGRRGGGHTVVQWVATGRLEGGHNGQTTGEGAGWEPGPEGPAGVGDPETQQGGLRWGA